MSQETSLLVRFDMVWLFGNTFSLVIFEGSLWNRVKCVLYQNPKPLSKRFIAILKCTQFFAHFEKKAQLYRLNSWKVIDSEKCGCLNARKLLFQNTLRESKCPQVPNTGELCRASLLSQFCSNPKLFWVRKHLFCSDPQS